MLHRFSSMLFLIAFITYFGKYIKFINNKICLKIHIITGTLACLGMVLYAITDYIKDKEITILPVAITSVLIILSGNKEFRKKYKWMHLASVFLFAGALSFHIIY